MIASVSFEMNGKPKTAIITDRREWYCADKTVERFLNAYFDPTKDGPSTGPAGSLAAYRAAEILPKGVARYNIPVSEDTETVY